MMKIFNLIILILLSNSVLSQKKNKKNIYPHSTSAEQRLKGYNDRLNLNSKSIVKNISFRNIGPTVMSGRVVDLDINPDDPSHFYVAYASGGLWETKNHGNSFVSLFDNQMVMTIGDIKVDWQNDIIYVGSGENNSSRSSYSGNGIYKSVDNGKSWDNIGLQESHHIGRIIIHPQNPDIIWVASLGHLYSSSNERGVYKYLDGGSNWTNKIYVKDYTGDIDLVLKRSTDGRKTWGDLRVIRDDSTNVCGNPSPVIDRKTGKTK